MKLSKEERKTKMLMIRTSSLALGWPATEYRLFLGAKTGKRQLARMTEAELELVYNEMNTILNEAMAERRKQRELKAQSDIQSIVKKEG